MTTPLWARLGSLTAAAGLTFAALASFAVLKVERLASPAPQDAPALEFITAAPPEPPPASTQKKAPPTATDAPTFAASAPVDGPSVPVDIIPADGSASGVTLGPPVVRTAVPLGLPPRPNYPPRAIARDKDGDVRVRLLIAPDGTVSSIAVLTETPPGWGFADAAITALRASRFEPQRVDGVAAPGEFEYTVRFRLE